MPDGERIKPDYKDLIPFIEGLERGNYQIPTFQREFEWLQDNIKKLWDSIFKFYPIGSFLIWKTDIPLEQHREIGGYILKAKESNFQYLLDGQQRATTLLLSLKGGDIKGRDAFDPTLFVDLTHVATEDEEDGYKSFFLFWDDIDDRGGKVTRNVQRKKRFDEGLIVKLNDIYKNYGELEKKLEDIGRGKFEGTERQNLRKARQVFDRYRLSLIWLEGIEVKEVCDIFDRVNTEGKPLDVVDIVVAKTFRNKTKEQEGFYLRDLFSDLRESLGKTQYVNLSDFIILQAIASVIMQNPDSKVKNITNTYMPRITASEIEDVWPDIEKALIETVRFLRDTLHLVGPNMIPYGYMYHALVNYFYQNKKPDYGIPKKWFWYTAFSLNGLANTTDLKNDIRKLLKSREQGAISISKLSVNRNALRREMYHLRSATSRAILALMAYQRPCDFLNKDRDVLQDVYLQLGDNPNLHHFFPINHLNNHPDQRNFENDSNSLMNIVYINQLENVRISDANPLTYLSDPEFVDQSSKEEIMQRHLIPLEVLEWAEDPNLTWANFDTFIEKRIDIFIQKIGEVLPETEVEQFDTGVSS